MEIWVDIYIYIYIFVFKTMNAKYLKNYKQSYRRPTVVFPVTKLINL